MTSTLESVEETEEILSTRSRHFVVIVINGEISQQLSNRVYYEHFHQSCYGGCLVHEVFNDDDNNVTIIMSSYPRNKYPW